MIPEGIGRIRGARVLVVEDNPVNQTLARDLLSHAGLHVDLAENGEMAIRAVQNASEPYDAIMMDVQMPVMDGLEASRIIRGELKLADVPIIATTANVQDEERERCLAAGANDCLTKPFDIPTLFACLLRFIPEKEPAGAVPAAGGNGHDAGHAADDVDGLEIVLPERIDGVDIEAGLARAGGNRGLYASLLVGFAETHASASSVAGDAAMNGDLDRVRFVAHGIRSTAGNIGANILAGTAGDLEDAIRTGGRLASLLKDFRAEVEKVISAIAASGVTVHRKAPPRPANDTPLDRDATATQMASLDRMLDDQDLAAEEAFGRLAALLGGRGFDASLDRIEASLEALEYAHARDILKSLREDLLD